MLRRSDSLKNKEKNDKNDGGVHNERSRHKRLDVELAGRVKLGNSEVCLTMRLRRDT